MVAWQGMLNLSLGLNGLSLASSFAMVVVIVRDREFRVMKERLVFCLAVVTFMYTLFNTAEHIANKEHDSDYFLPDGIILGAYACWWGLLMIETLLSGFLVWVLYKASTAQTLKPIKMKPRTEVAFAVGIFLWMLGAGLTAFFTVGRECDGFNDLSLSGGGKCGPGMPHNLTDIKPCLTAVETMCWSYIACLVFPLTLQMMLGAQMFSVCCGKNKGGSTAMLVRSTVLKGIVKPLRWYPTMFLVSAAGYVLWMLSISPRIGTNKECWAANAGMGSALTFSLKGFVNALIFFCSRGDKAGLCRRKKRASTSPHKSDANILLEYSESESDDDELEQLYGESENLTASSVSTGGRI